SRPARTPCAASPPASGGKLCKRAATLATRVAEAGWERPFPPAEPSASGERAARLELFTNEPGDGEETDRHKDGVEPVEPGLELVDVLAELHADPGEAEAPGERSGEGVDDELAHRQPGDAGVPHGGDDALDPERDGFEDVGDQGRTRRRRPGRDGSAP